VLIRATSGRSGDRGVVRARPARQRRQDQRAGQEKPAHQPHSTSHRLHRSTNPIAQSRGRAQRPATCYRGGGPAGR
jgi:hypothetical protein